MSQFQVKETQTTDYMTILRLNAAQYGIRGTKERLGLLIINSVLTSILMKWERGIAKSGSLDRRCFKTAPNGWIDFKLSMEGSFGR